ncbi:lincomycin resistance protein LmrB [Bifidobacterium ramosum]|uniref:DHA2 family efflux MFS transporter permease subunit n=1 Tax=Bifidobacterium ramosum TaxID=1798158 RepID=A0A6L4WXR3_9BIFI|nr:DHA2 family efflux MFS transporter permease subunit [Bifidobacterium ramosum]KAB8287015.1 lincomycin resistance protein LmrB [Bifidobacterium ramosum]NEG72478.1 DHA2 family efflux MFS transporter permease subunit [Bifidobacterium ramosum]
MNTTTDAQSSTVQPSPPVPSPTQPAAQSSAQPVNGKRPVPAAIIVCVIALAILTFLGILSETSLNIAYSTLMQEFAVDASTVQWLTTGYLLLLSVAIPSSPFMVRRFATKTLFVAAVAIFTAGTLIGAFAASFPMLLAARLVMALGTGISLPLITNIILEKAPLEQRGAMLGIVSLVTCAAPAIGPVFGGMVMEWLDWHWIFYTMLPFLLVAFLLGMATVPEIRHPGDAEQATISVPSLLLVAAGLAGLIVAVSFFASWNGDWRFWLTLAASVAVLVVFVLVQLRMTRPLVEVRVFTYPGFSLGMLILLMASGGVLGLNFMLPILLQRGFGMGSLPAALTLLPGAVVGAIAAPLIGGALKNHFPPKFIMTGFAVVTVMDMVLVLASGSVAAVAVAYAVFMAFSGFVLVPDQTHALNQLPARLNADGSAVMNTVQQLAGAIGTAVASVLLSEFSAAAARGGASEAASYVRGFSLSMWVLAGMAVVGVVLAALMFRCSTRHAPELVEA